MRAIRIATSLALRARAEIASDKRTYETSASENLRPPLPSGGGELERIQSLLDHMSAHKVRSEPMIAHKPATLFGQPPSFGLHSSGHRGDSTGSIDSAAQFEVVVREFRLILRVMVARSPALA